MWTHSVCTFFQRRSGPFDFLTDWVNLSLVSGCFETCWGHCGLGAELSHTEQRTLTAGPSLLSAQTLRSVTSLIVIYLFCVCQVMKLMRRIQEKCDWDVCVSELWCPVCWSLTPCGSTYSSDDPQNTNHVREHCLPHRVNRGIKQ